MANLEVQSEAGYDSTLTMVSNTEGLYQTGEIYHIQTTHNVDVATGAVLDDCRIQFKGSNNPFYLGYDLDTGFYELDDSDDYVAIHPSSSASQLSTGGIQVDWKFVVNGGWDDEEILIILSETLADNGVVGMLSGISLDPEVGNAVENDILVNGLTLYNSAGTEQELSQAYSNQIFQLSGNVTFEGLNVSPSPTSYNMVVEKRGFEIDGQFTNITWTEMANTSGFIGGLFDWNVDLGVFASGSETYRFRITNYNGGDILCPPEYGQIQTANSIQHL